MKLRLGGEKSRQRVLQVLKCALSRVILSPVVREVEGGREGVRLEHHTRTVAEERVQGGNGGDERHELKLGDAVGVTRARREGKGEEEPLTVTLEAKELPVL
eukprot:2635944-Pleurochrysis_carterae.AAC.1